MQRGAHPHMQIRRLLAGMMKITKLLGSAQTQRRARPHDQHRWVRLMLVLLLPAVLRACSRLLLSAPAPAPLSIHNCLGSYVQLHTRVYDGKPCYIRTAGGKRKPKHVSKSLWNHASPQNAASQQATWLYFSSKYQMCVPHCYVAKLACSQICL